MKEVSEGPDDGKASNSLLDQFFRGFPICFLSELLRHPKEQVIASALFIADELGTRGAPVLDDVIAHTAHSNPRIRRSARGAISCLCGGDAIAYLHVCRGVFDPDLHCRRLAMLLMMRATDARLSDCLRATGDATADRELRDGLAMLLGESSRDPLAVQAWLLDQNPLIRRFGLIAAGRLFQSHPHLLDTAAKSCDEEVATCAAGQKEFIEILQRRRNRT